MVNVAKTPNREVLSGYVNRGQYIDLPRLFGRDYDYTKEPPNQPRQRALNAVAYMAQLEKLKAFFETVALSAHKSVCVLATDNFKMYKFYNDKHTEVLYIKHDFFRKRFERSVIYHSDALARMRFSTGTITWCEELPFSVG